MRIVSPSERKRPDRQTQPAGQVHPESDTTPELGPKGGIPLLVGGLLGNFIFGAAVIVTPQIAISMHLNSGLSSLVVSLFAVGFAAALIFGGRVGDSYGRRRAFRGGLTLMLIATVGVACAPEPISLLIARVLQGIGAGIMLPQVLSTIGHTTTGAARARWLSAYAAVIGAGTLVGQLAGGLLLGLHGLTSSQLLPGWRLVFMTTALLTIFPLLASRNTPETRSGHSTGTNPLGALLFGAGIAGVLLSLSLGPGAKWAWRVLLIFGVALILLVLFVLWERHSGPGRALLPVSALRELALLRGLAQVLVFFTGYGAFVYVYTVATETSRGLGALLTSVSLIIFSLGFVGTAMLTPELVKRWGAFRVMQMSALGQALVLVLLAWLILSTWPHLPELELQVLLALLGSVQGAMYTPLLGTVLAAVPRNLAGVASGLLSTSQQLAIAIGVALLGMLFSALGSGGTGLACCLLVEGALAVIFFTLSTLRFRGRATRIPAEPSPAD